MDDSRATSVSSTVAAATDGRTNDVSLAGERYRTCSLIKHTGRTCRTMFVDLRHRLGRHGLAAPRQIFLQRPRPKRRRRTRSGSDGRTDGRTAPSESAICSIHLHAYNLPEIRWMACRVVSLSTARDADSSGGYRRMADMPSGGQIPDGLELQFSRDRPLRKPA